MVAAGAVVTRNVKPYAMVMGVPAKHVGWVCKCGNILDDSFSCGSCGSKYILIEDEIKEI